MENPLSISLINDFIFCPVSIYFHMVDADLDKLAYESYEQLSGSELHNKIDNYQYSDKKSIFQGITVYCDKYNLQGKIDIYDSEKRMLVERKRKISEIYDGYVFQLYSYYFSLTEMGYEVERLRFHSMLDNKSYDIDLPEDNPEMFHKYETTMEYMRKFDMSSFVQDNSKKCAKCVYEPLCSFSRLEV